MSAILSGMYSFLGDNLAQRAPKGGSAAQKVLSVRADCFRFRLHMMPPNPVTTV